jgi:tagaturonate reductase
MILFLGKEGFHYNTKMKKLNRNTHQAIYNAPERIMQFGGGNFLRAFTDWMFDVLNKETDFKGSVVIIKPTQGGDYEELKEQDGLFHVVLDGIHNGQLMATTTLVESVTRVIQPYTQWKEYLKLAENPELRFIVSNTTEAGIRFSDSDTVNDNPPAEFPAKLAVWLHHRFEFFKGEKDKGCLILPCELIEQNGDALQETIIQYAKHFGYAAAFIDWIKEHNYFYNTLVDRIVSGFPKEQSEKIIEKIGYNDSQLVAGEYYHSWVIQGDKIIQEELPFAQTNLNVQFVKDIKPYREMKVRILNGAHTSLALVGYLAGLRTVKEVMDSAEVAPFVNEILQEEIVKTLPDFSSTELNAFVNAVLDRFRNPSLKHFLINIALNSTAKFTARLYPALAEYTATYNALPERIVTVLASLILFYKGNYKGEIIPVNDNQQTVAIFKTLWDQKEKGTIDYKELAISILREEQIWGVNLDAIPNLSETVAANLEKMTKF